MVLNKLVAMTIRSINKVVLTLTITVAILFCFTGMLVATPTNQNAELTNDTHQHQKIAENTTKAPQVKKSDGATEVPLSKQEGQQIHGEPDSEITDLGNKSARTHTKHDGSAGEHAEPRGELEYTYPDYHELFNDSNIHVLPPRPQTEWAAFNIQEMNATHPPESTTRYDAVTLLQRSLDEYMDPVRVQSQSTFGLQHRALRRLERIDDENVSHVSSDAVTMAAEETAGTALHEANQLVRLRGDELESLGEVENLLADAEYNMEKAEDKLKQRGVPYVTSRANAVKEYGKSWNHTQEAIDIMDEEIRPELEITDASYIPRDDHIEVSLHGEVRDVRAYEYENATVSVNGVEHSEIDLFSSAAVYPTATFSTTLELNELDNFVEVHVSGNGQNASDSYAFEAGGFADEFFELSYEHEETGVVVDAFGKGLAPQDIQITNTTPEESPPEAIGPQVHVRELGEVENVTVRLPIEDDVDVSNRNVTVIYWNPHDNETWHELETEVDEEGNIALGEKNFESGYFWVWLGDFTAGWDQVILKSDVQNLDEVLPLKNTAEDGIPDVIQEDMNFKLAVGSGEDLYRDPGLNKSLSDSAGDGFKDGEVIDIDWKVSADEDDLHLYAEVEDAVAHPGTGEQLVSKTVFTGFGLPTYVDTGLGETGKPITVKPNINDRRYFERISILYYPDDGENLDEEDYPGDSVHCSNTVNQYRKTDAKFFVYASEDVQFDGHRPDFKIKKFVFERPTNQPNTFLQKGNDKIDTINLNQELNVNLFLSVCDTAPSGANPFALGEVKYELRMPDSSEIVKRQDELPSVNQGTYKLGEEELSWETDQTWDEEYNVYGLPGKAEYVQEVRENLAPNAMDKMWEKMDAAMDILTGIQYLSNPIRIPLEFVTTGIQKATDKGQPEYTAVDLVVPNAEEMGVERDQFLKSNVVGKISASSVTRVSTMDLTEDLEELVDDMPGEASVEPEAKDDVVKLTRTDSGSVGSWELSVSMIAQTDEGEFTDASAEIVGTNVWSEGDTLELELDETSPKLDNMEQLYVELVHEPSRTQVYADVLDLQSSEGVFEIEEIKTNSPVFEGDKVQVTVRVNNTGSAATQPVSLYLDDVVEDQQSVELAEGETAEISLTWSTNSSDIGNNNLTVKTGQSERTVTVRVREIVGQKEFSGQTFISPFKDRSPYYSSTDSETLYIPENQNMVIEFSFAANADIRKSWLTPLPEQAGIKFQNGTSVGTYMHSNVQVTEWYSWASGSLMNEQVGAARGQAEHRIEVIDGQVKYYVDDRLVGTTRTTSSYGGEVYKMRYWADFYGYHPFFDDRRVAVQWSDVRVTLVP